MNASVLAKYIVTKCTKERCPISNLQLQKILFFIQKQFLIQKGVPLFDNMIQAWHFGPVVPDVYNQFCGFGSSPIEWVFDEVFIPQGYKALIDKIVEEKRCMDPWLLVSETHKKGNAWDRIYNDGVGAYREIPIELIKELG